MSGGGEGAAQKWARERFLSFSVLKTASGIQDQLSVQVKNLLKNNRSGVGENVVKTSSFFPPPRRFSSHEEKVRFCVVSGFFPSSAQRRKVGEYVTILTRVAAQLPPTSALASSTAEFVVFHELAMTAEKSYLSVVTVAEPTWLEETSRGLFFIRGKVAKEMRRDDQRVLQEFSEKAVVQQQNSNSSSSAGAPLSRAQQTLNLAAALLQQQQQFGMNFNTTTNNTAMNSSSINQNTNSNNNGNFDDEDNNDNNLMEDNFNNTNAFSEFDSSSSAMNTTTTTSVKVKAKFVPKCKR